MPTLRLFCQWNASSITGSMNNAPRQHSKAPFDRADLAGFRQNYKIDLGSLLILSVLFILDLASMNSTIQPKLSVSSCQYSMVCLSETWKRWIVPWQNCKEGTYCDVLDLFLLDSFACHPELASLLPLEAATAYSNLSTSEAPTALSTSKNRLPDLPELKRQSRCLANCPKAFNQISKSWQSAASKNIYHSIVMCHASSIFMWHIHWPPHFLQSKLVLSLVRWSIKQIQSGGPATKLL